MRPCVVDARALAVAVVAAMLRRLTSVDVLNGGRLNTSGRRREGRWHVQCGKRGQPCQLSQ
eukprot:1607900-Pyramimonas_sp.AAC.1